MPYDDAWLADVLAKGQVRLVGSGGAGDRGRESADTPGLARPHVSEKAFQAAVVRVAKASGWSVYHTHDSRRSPSGFPDLVLVRNNLCIFAELKTQDGVVTLAQWHWLRALGQVEKTEAGIWRPEQWDTIQARLRD